MAILLRDATAFDADSVQALLFDHGPNPWNWLPPEGVALTLQQLVAGLCRGVLAEDGTVLVGAVLYRRAAITPATALAPACCRPPASSWPTMAWPGWWPTATKKTAPRPA